MGELTFIPSDEPDADLTRCCVCGDQGVEFAAILVCYLAPVIANQRSGEYVITTLGANTHYRFYDWCDLVGRVWVRTI